MIDESKRIEFIKMCCSTQICDHGYESGHKEISYTLFQESLLGKVAVTVAWREETARRLAACWNAVIGIKTEDLEKVNVPSVEQVNSESFITRWNALELHRKSHYQTSFKQQ